MPLIRRVLQRYWRLRRGLTLGARGIVIDGDGRLLLIRHTYQPGWMFPGGGVEFAETIETALARELDEEAGVILTGPVELFGIYSNHRVFPGDHVALYTIRQWRIDRVAVPSREIAEMGFFHPDAPPSGTTAGTQRRIEELMGRRERQTIW
jgi:8-oxo-dGTP pyrophosphatase MutT (NUDIX family)